jgi:hypothetical protein
MEKDALAYFSRMLLVMFSLSVCSNSRCILGLVATSKNFYAVFCRPFPEPAEPGRCIA